MSRLAFSSYKQRTDEALLSRLSDDIFMLKLQAQGSLVEQDFDAQDVQNTLDDLRQLLMLLINRVRFMALGQMNLEIDQSFTALADRFIKENPADVQDRVAEIERLVSRLSLGTPAIKDRDFVHLDNLQVLLEQEAAEGVQGLYRF